MKRLLALIAAVLLSAGPASAQYLPGQDDTRVKVADLLGDWLVTGLVPSVPGGGGSLTADTPSGVCYAHGSRVVSAGVSKTYTASRDTYVDIAFTGVFTYVVVNNGAGAPAVTTNNLRLFKVVTDGTKITAVTTTAASSPTATFSNIPSTTLTNTHFLVGNGSNVATDVAMSGDATLASTGVLTLKNTGPGVQTSTNATVTTDAQGRITALAAGSGGGTSPLLIPNGVDAIYCAGAMTVSPDGKSIYVNGYYDNTFANYAIQQIDVATGTATKVDLGASGGITGAIRVSPDSSKVYIVDSGQAKLWVLTASTMAIANTVTLTATPGASFTNMDLNKSGTKLIISTTEASNKAYLVDTTSLVVTTLDVSGHGATGGGGATVATAFYNNSDTTFAVTFSGTRHPQKIDIWSTTPTFSSTITGTDGGTNVNAINLVTSALSGTNVDVLLVTGTTAEIFRNGTSNVVLVGAGTPNPVPVVITDTDNKYDRFICQESSTRKIPSISFVGRVVGSNRTDHYGAPALTVDSGLVAMAAPPAGSISTRGFNTIYGAGDNSDFGQIYSIPLSFGSAPTFQSVDQTITAAGALTLAHNLVTTPQEVWYALVNQTAEANYTAGQVVFIGGTMDTTFVANSNAAFSAIVDATNITIRYGSDASSFNIPDATTGAATAITNTKWKLRVFAK